MSAETMAREIEQTLLRKMAGRWGVAALFRWALLLAGILLGVGIGGALLAAGVVIAWDDIARWLGVVSPWSVPFRVRQMVLALGAGVALLTWLLLVIAPAGLALATSDLAWRWLGPGAPAAFALAPLDGRQRVRLLRQALARRLGWLLLPFGLTLALAPLSTVAFTLFWDTIYQVLPLAPQFILAPRPQADWYFWRAARLAAVQLLNHSGFALALAALLVPARAVGLYAGMRVRERLTGRMAVALGILALAAIGSMVYLAGLHRLSVVLLVGIALPVTLTFAHLARTHLAVTNG